MHRPSRAAFVLFGLSLAACARTVPFGFDGVRVLSHYDGTPLAVVSGLGGGGSSSIAGAGPTSASPRGAALTSTASKPREHQVQAGETLWRIARTYGLGPKELAKANDIEDPTLVQVGRRLRIPGGAAPEPAKAAPVVAK